ncbi:MAG: YitT family protein [Bacteroidales bacterium]|nr:YitT family protein [Candidatus Physcousia equi]
MPKKLSYAQVFDIFKDFFFINLGMAIYSVGWALFLLPNHITTGGGAGLAAILQYATNFPMQYSLLLLNGVLLIAAWWQLGTKFALKTLYAVLALSIYLGLSQSLITQDDGTLLNVLGENQEGMACILGAVLNGIGIGMVFMSGGCTGGWDIIAAIINKYKNVSIGRVLLYIDLFVIGSCYFLFHSWQMVVFGYVTLVVYTFAVDTMINSSKQDIQFTVYTKESDRLVEVIRKETGHTATLLLGEGGYTHDQLRVVVTIVHKSEQVQMLRLIRDTDQQAFVTFHRVEGAFGLGFNAIKA